MARNEIKEVIYKKVTKNGTLFRLPNMAQGAEDSLLLAPTELMDETFGSLGPTKANQITFIKVEVKGDKIVKFINK